jgi:prepilin-type N-terminal cleavage/methylation domain-containing protein
MSTLRTSRGFTVAEIVIVIALLGILASIVVLNYGGSDRSANERVLRNSLQELRAAILAYRADHGHYPCSSADHGYPCDDRALQHKLTRFSDKAGRTHNTRTGAFVFGPYLDAFPREPFSRTDSLTWSLGTARLKETIATAIHTGRGNGGWFYEPESGNILPNLGASYSVEYARF